VKVTNEKIENRQAFLTVEMEPGEMEESLGASYRRLVNSASIPGFRKGKAPRDVAERFIGSNRIMEEALNQIIPDAYAKAIQEQEIEAIAQPQIEIIQTDPVIFKATVPLMPIVELGNYRSIRIKPEVEKVTKEKSAAVLEQMRHQHATWEPVERTVEFSDLVGLDIESSVDGEPFINQQGAQYQVLHDFPGPVPGFSEQLVGMNKGEEKEFQLKVPDDYHQNELAGKESHFKVKITEVKDEKLPELNNELAQQIGADFKDLDALKDEVTTKLKERAEEKAKIDFENKIVQAVVDASQVNFPPVMIETEIDHILNEQARQLQWNEKGLEGYLKRVNKTVEQLREEMRPTAEKRITASLALGKLAEEEKVQVSDDEIDTEIEQMVGRTLEKKEELQIFLNSEQSRSSIKQVLMIRKTVELLGEIAKGKEKVKVNAKEAKKND